LLEINLQDIHIDKDKLSQYDNPHVAAINKKLKKNNTLRLNLKPVGSKTGRASFGKGSLHIYSLPKEMRSIITAQDGYKIVQFDYKNFQARIAISLTSDEEFKRRFLLSKDFYSEFGGDREEVKLSFLSWLFSDRYSEAFDQQAQPIRAHKENLYEQFLEAGQIKNVFGRPLFFGENDPKHLIYQNYISSTEADMILELSSIILEKLNKNKEVRLLFPFHDAFVFEIKEDKLNIVSKLEKVISTYHLKTFNTIFPVEIKAGNNFGEMTIFDHNQE
jgi:DNA polymerase I-like protein with 3'-5' exonuclease and polymerase domains